MDRADQPATRDLIRRLAAVSVGWAGIGMVADGVPTLLVPYQVSRSGGDATQLGFLTMAAIAVAALLQPMAGAWSDRVGRVPVIVAGLASALIGLFLLVRPEGLLAGTVLALTGASVVQAGYQGLLPDRIAPVWRGRASGAKGMMDVGGAFVGFALVGSMLATNSEALAVASLALGLALTAGLGVFLLDRADAPVRLPVPRPRLSGTLVQVVVARFLFLLGIFAVGRFLLLFLEDGLRLGTAGAGNAGLVLAILASLTAAAALPAGWLADRFGRPHLLLVGGVMGGVGIAAMPLAGSLAGVLGFGGLMAIGTAAFNASSWAMLADLAHGPSAGRLLGVANLGTAGAAAAAGLFGPLIDSAGYGLAFGLAGVTAVAGAAIGWRAGSGPVGQARRMEAGADA